MAFGPDDEDDKEIINGKENDAQEDDVEGQEDDGQGEDDAAAEDDGEADGQEDGSQGRVRPGRGASREQRLANERRELAAENARLKARAEEAERRAQERRQEVDPELERQRLALMTPEERMEFQFNRSQEQNQRQMAAMRVQMWDTGDKAAFTALAAADPVAAKYKDKVEQLFQEQMRKGAPVDRETCLNYVVGQAMRQKAPAARDRQTKQGAARIRQQTTRPTNAQGDVSPNRRRGEQTVEERLADVTF